MAANLGSVGTSIHTEQPRVAPQSVPEHDAEQSPVEAFLVPSQSLESIVREVNRLLITLAAKKLDSLYKLLDIVEREQEQAVVAMVGTYRDRTVFWIQMATCGLQAIAAVPAVAPQACTGVADSINSLTNGLFGRRAIDLTHFLEDDGTGAMVYNFSEIAKAADKVFKIPPEITQAFGSLSDQSLKGDQTEKQSLMDRLSALLTQRRQECTKDIDKVEEAQRNYQAAVNQENQVRQSIASR